MLGRVEREAANEGREAPQQDPLVLSEEGVAPVHRGLKRLLARQYGAAAAREEMEAVHQAFGDLLRTHHPRPCRREFDSKRNAIESLADLGHGGGIVVSHLKVRPDRYRPLDEEANCLVLREGLDDRRSLLVGECEGGHPPGHLSLYTEGLPAGGEKAQRRTGIEQAVDEFRAGRHQVLAVIEENKHSLGAKAVLERFQEELAGDFLDAKRCRKCILDEAGFRNLGQVHPPDAVGMSLEGVGGDLKAEAGLTDASGAGQSNQPVFGESFPEPGHLCLTADEAGQAGGQVVGKSVKGAQGRELDRQTGVVELVDVLGPGEVTQAICAKVQEADSLGKPVRHEVVARPGEKRLAAVADGPQALATLNRRPDVVPLVAQLDFSSLQRRAEAQFQATRPGLFRHG